MPPKPLSLLRSLVFSCPPLWQLPGHRYFFSLDYEMCGDRDCVSTIPRHLVRVDLWHISKCTKKSPAKVKTAVNTGKPPSSAISSQ